MKGTDALLPRSENVAAIVEPTDEEVDAAITGNMGHLVTVVSTLALLLEDWDGLGCLFL